MSSADSTGVKSTVFLCLQANDDTRGIVEAIREDNAGVAFDWQPGMVRITAPGTLRVVRESVEEQVGRAFDLQELHIHMISLSGHVEETDDELSLSWDR